MPTSVHLLLQALHYNLTNLQGSLAGVLMLPDAEAYPSSLSETLVSVTVTLDGLCHLLRPERGVRDRHRMVLRASMPKAAVEKYGDPGPCEHQISGPPDTFERLGRDLVAKSERMDGRPQSHFWLSVPALVGLHARPHSSRRRPRLDHASKRRTGVPGPICRSSSLTSLA